MDNPMNLNAPVETRRTVATWIAEINDACRNSTGWVIETGLCLLRAKEALPHGQWLALWDGHQLNFGLRTGEMLMRIARHPTLRDPKYISSFPAAWSVLYVLSQMAPEAVEGGITDGAITPELKLSQARRLLVRSHGTRTADPGPAAPPPFDLVRQKARFIQSIRRRATRWPAELRGELIAALEAAAAELRRAGGQA